MEEIQVDGADVQGFVIGHKARLAVDGPWGQIEHVAVKEGAVMVTVSFEIGHCEVEAGALIETKQSAYEIRVLDTGKFVYACESRRQALRMLDELDALGATPYYSVDLDTGKRHLGFNAIGYLAQRGLTQEAFFARRVMPL